MDVMAAKVRIGPAIPGREGRILSWRLRQAADAVTLCCGHFRERKGAPEHFPDVGSPNSLHV